MNKIQIRLDTQTDVRKFVGLSNGIQNPVYLEDGTGFRADGKSILGVMYGMSEFNQLFVISDYENLETRFKEFLV